jgi:serine protease Do
LPVPEKLLAIHSNARFGTHWESTDGGIALDTLLVPEAQVPFDKLYRRMSEGRGRQIEYSLFRDPVFVLSGHVGERSFYAAVVKTPLGSRGISISWNQGHDDAGFIISDFLASALLGQPQVSPSVPQAGGGAPPGGTPPAEAPPGGRAQPVLSGGSGFAISTDGVIATDAHVVDHCASVEVTGFGTANLITADSQRDLAVIQIASGHLPSAAKIQGRTPELGQAIVAIGYPLSDVMGNALTISPGVVSSLSGLGGDKSKFSVSANLQPGNSGGPILDMHANVVGVAEAKLNEITMLKVEGTTGGSVGFAIDTNTLLDFLRPFKTEIADIAGGPGDLSVQDVVARAKGFTVQIVCHQSASAAPASAGPAAAASSEPLAPTEVVTETFRVAGVASWDAVKLRTGPGIQFPIVVTIPPDGSGVATDSCKSIVGYSRKWCRANWRGYQGWVSSCCLLGEKTGRPPD